MTNDMRLVIVPKSDQLNSDDLIGGSKTIKITRVEIRPGTEQPTSIFFEGDNGKPYKACKSMCRVMVHAWGADARAYIGRSMTLYNDPTVKWGGMAVGGIRISHMSDIKGKMDMALTATKGQRKVHTVMPLTGQQTAQTTTGTPRKTAADWCAEIDLLDMGGLAEWQATNAAMAESADPRVLGIWQYAIDRGKSLTNSLTSDESI